MLPACYIACCLANNERANKESLFTPFGPVVDYKNKKENYDNQKQIRVSRYSVSRPTGFRQRQQRKK